MKYKKLGIFLITILYLTLLASFVKIFVADQKYTFSQKDLQSGKIEDSLKKAKESININPNEPRYYYEYAKALLTSTAYLENANLEEIKKEAFQNLQKAETLNSKNLTTLRNSVPIYYFLTVKDLMDTSSETNIDANYLPITKEFLKRLKDNYPNDVGVQALVAKYEKRLFLNEEYNQTIENIKILRPDLLEWYLE